MDTTYFNSLKLIGCSTPEKRSVPCKVAPCNFCRSPLIQLIHLRTPDSRAGLDLRSIVRVTGFQRKLEFHVGLAARCARTEVIVGFGLLYYIHTTSHAHLTIEEMGTECG